MTELVITTFLWKNRNPHREGPASFTHEHVNIMSNMLERNMHRPYRFVCITDDPTLDSVETFPLWSDYTDLTHHPHSETFVSCYPRLKLFSPEVGEALGASRILSLDLDIVICGSMESLLDRWDSLDTPFMGYRVKPNSRPLTYNGSMLGFDVGAPEVTQLWTDFDLDRSPEQARLFNYRGSDQAWISYKLGNNYPFWGEDDGVLAYRLHMRQRHDLPPGAAMVHFFGRHRPWHDDAQSARWVQEHYR